MRGSGPGDPEIGARGRTPLVARNRERAESRHPAMKASLHCPSCGSADVARFETRLTWDDRADGLRCGACRHEELLPDLAYIPQPEEAAARLVVEQRWRRGRR